MKKVLFCCLLFLGVICIGCKNNDNFDDAVIEEIDIEKAETDNSTNNSKGEDIDFFEKGNIALNNGNLDEAIELFNKALEEDNTSDATYGDLGRAKEQNNDLNGAIECYTKAIELNNERSIYYQWRAEAYRRSNKQDLAEKDQKIADELHAKGMD